MSPEPWHLPVAPTSSRPDAEELELSFGSLPEAAQEHVERLIEERDRALAEVHRLRQHADEMRPIVSGLRLEIDVRKRGEEELAKQRDELRSEVERLELATATVRGEGMAAGEKRERIRIRKELIALVENRSSRIYEIEEYLQISPRRLIESINHVCLHEED